MKKRKHATGKTAARKKRRVVDDSTEEEEVEVAMNTGPPIASVSGPSPALTRQKTKMKNTRPHLRKKEVKMSSTKKKRS